ncbi:arsenite methyltransferase [Halovivax gelatinilyticus]|uniref:arsenite methyltransferase n=1 Tax=Halovivax gelatinilyticus TaxID=2961597 RepID=UPI0020CA6694|nr:arsenite methyltransferase [Halovivax gelatinilyticus]
MTTDSSDHRPTEDEQTDRTEFVRDRYAEIASAESDCCGGSADVGDPDGRSRDLGYDDDDLDEAPDGSNLGLGCGNPVALANLEPGETVLDLGSGGGFDCFLAAREVGPEGRVIGVDMTPEMLDRARENARESDIENVEFRLGEIEHLPVADETVDAIISNCVINLSDAKRRVLAEAYRVLAPGGRLSISDLVATDPLPDAVRTDPTLVSGCVGGAAPIERYESWLADLGFQRIDVTVDGEWDASYDGEPLPIVSARIEAVKPA